MKRTWLAIAIAGALIASLGSQTRFFNTPERSPKDQTSVVQGATTVAGATRQTQKEKTTSQSENTRRSLPSESSSAHDHGNVHETGLNGTQPTLFSDLAPHHRKVIERAEPSIGTVKVLGHRGCDGSSPSEVGKKKGHSLNQ